MKQLRNKLSGLLLLLRLAIFWACPFTLSFLLGYQVQVSYLAVLLLLLFTWFIYRGQGKSLSELGLTFKGHTFIFLPLGVTTGILFFSLLFATSIPFNGIQLHLNKDVDYWLMAEGIFWLLPTVMVEELIFRGYCFKETVERIGTWKANGLFSLLFISWHWIAFHAWGNYGMMLGLITTGFGHWLFATALLKSGTLYFPIGLHLGNNWASHHLFSSNTGGIHVQVSQDVLFRVSRTRLDVSVLQLVTGNLITFVWFLLFIWLIKKWPQKSKVI